MFLIHTCLLIKGPFNWFNSLGPSWIHKGSNCIEINLIFVSWLVKSCKSLPQEINYEKIDTLSLEARENLNKIKPKNFGDASKIPGVSKADLTALLVWLKIREIKKGNANIFVEKKLSS